MRAQMMDRPLLINQLLWRGEHVFAEKEIVTRLPGAYHRYTYAQLGLRARRLAQALTRLGVGPGDRVGTLAWNTHQHYESYFGVPCMGAVLHTINLRLFPEQIAYVINHAADSVLLVEPDQLPVLEKIATQLRTVRAYVVLGEGPVPETSLAPVLGYEELLAAEDGDLVWPEFDENTAAAMCYTSATTGDPKGVVYSHRSVVLHSLNLALHGSIGVREEATFLPISPMFHANSWGIPHAAAMQGTKLVLPGPHPVADDYLDAIEREGVTHAVAAVSVGVMIRDALQRRDRDLSRLQVLWLGGQAPPLGLIRWFRDRYGVEVPQGWGMTEASPLATFTAVKKRIREAGQDAVDRTLVKQGLPMPGIEVRLADESGAPLPWDGETVGEFLLRGPTVTAAYHDDPRTADSFVDGWFRTGDVGVIDPDGYLQLTDRAKDLIKSGGEWISSVELENALMSHPAVAEAAVVAVPDERWLERPLACVVAREPVTAEDLRAHLADRFAKWQLPDEFLVVPEIPKTGVGKSDKKVLRARFAEPASREALRAPDGS
ncbi:long-chain fatty acid--CoA ligase [Pseudonocardia bannensis]|nr:long-chain fatty acid--CoA ligase [Pseudonocardia bannensis]